MYACLAQTPVLSPMTINAVRKKYTNLAIGDLDNTGSRIILNPFNFFQAAEPGAASTLVPDSVLSDRAEPEFLRIPEFVEGVRTLEFMGFDNRTAILIWHKYRNGPPRPEAEDLLWCAMQYLTYVEGQATRDGIDDQHLIKELMGFHYGETLFRIDTDIPVTPVTLLGPRVLSWIIPIISRRYEFVYDLERNLADSQLNVWSAGTEARTMNYGSRSLREGVESWFHHIADAAMAAQPGANDPANMLLREEAAITAFEFFDVLYDVPAQKESMDAVECDDSFPEDMTICKVPVLIEPCFIEYQPN